MLLAECTTLLAALYHTSALEYSWLDRHTIDGRTVHYYNKEVEDLKDRPKWQKDFYKNHLKPLTRAIDADWAGPNDDFAVQVNVMQGKGEKVLPHFDAKDVSCQHGIGLGNCEGGDLITCNGSDRRKRRDAPHAHFPVFHQKAVTYFR